MFILSQGLFSFSQPASEKAGEAQRAERGHSQDHSPKLAKGIPCGIMLQLGGNLAKGMGIDQQVATSGNVHHSFYIFQLF